MADPADTESGEDDQSAKGLRGKLEAAIERANKAEGSVVELNTALAFYDANLGHLTDEQREDVLTLARAKGQTGASDLKAIADRLSYAPPPQQAEPAPQAGEPAQAGAQDPAVKMELSQLANLAAGSSGQRGPQTPGALDLSEYTDNKSLKDFLMTVVDDDFGPTFE